jgi:hypothetical protein
MDPLQRGDNHKNAKRKRPKSSKKNLPLKNYRTRKAQIYINAFGHSSKLNFLKIMPPPPQGSGEATIGETVFTCVYIGKILLKLSSQEPLSKKS